jgi:AraC-like DNA-binding protein
MNVEKLPKLPPIEVGFRVDPRLPVIPFAMEVERAGCAAPHAHPRGQVIYASSGVMRVVCGRDVWVVPPSQAVWVPPEVEHEVYFPGEVALRNLFVDPSQVGGLPERVTVLKVSPLLRELVLKAVTIGDGYEAGGAQWRLMQVLLDELRQAPPTPLHLPMARDERVLRVMDALIADPGDNRDLASWGELAGASGRNLARLFVAQTGMTFGAWRRRLLMQQAIDRLDRGDAVTGIAFDLGYRSLSAFVEMFRKELGGSPRQYLKKEEGRGTRA